MYTKAECLKILGISEFKFRQNLLFSKSEKINSTNYWKVEDVEEEKKRLDGEREEEEKKKKEKELQSIKHITEKEKEKLEKEKEKLEKKLKLEEEKLEKEKEKLEKKLKLEEEKKKKKEKELQSIKHVTEKEETMNFLKILRKYFCWYENRLHYRTHTDIKEWATVKHINPFLELTKVKRGSKTALQYLNEQYIKFVTEKDITYLLTNEEFKNRVLLGNIYDPKRVDMFLKNYPKEEIALMKKIETFTNDPNKDAYKYFDITNIKKGSHDTWDTWEEGMNKEDTDVFRCFVYAIYNEKNTGRQILWLRDRGETGKTRISNALSRFGGDNFYQPVTKADLESQFFGSFIVGKRLLVFEDCTDKKLLSNSQIRSISGGGTISVNEKNNKHVYPSQTNSKLIVTSNKRPEIDNTPADMSRLILIEPKSLRDSNIEKFEFLERLGNDVIEDSLIYELPFYLYTCKQTYEKLNVKNKIPLTEKQKEKIKQCFTSSTQLHSHFLDTYLSFKPGLELSFEQLSNLVNQARQLPNFMNLDRQVVETLMLENDNVFKIMGENSQYASVGLSTKGKKLLEGGMPWIG